MLYLFSSLAILGWVGKGRHPLKWGRFGFRRLRRYFLSWHPSAQTDYRFFIINRWLFGLLLGPLFAALDGMVAQSFSRFWGNWAPHGFTHPISLHLNSLTWNVALSGLTLVAMDLGFFLSHLLQHRLPALWAFHQVHHSAEILTPVTAYRVHPVDDVLALSVSGLLVGGVEGFFILFAPESTHILTLSGVHCGLIIFYLAGFNARHSSAWISFGTFWSQWFISPVQHQLHHSVDPKHLDKNFGFIFAFWDRMAGTLLIPSRPIRIRVGLKPENHEIQQSRSWVQSVWGFYTHPFVSLWKMRSSNRSIPFAGRGIAGLIILLLGELIWINEQATFQYLASQQDPLSFHISQVGNNVSDLHNIAAEDRLTGAADHPVSNHMGTSGDVAVPHSLWVEDLRSPELQQWIHKGYDTLLIPTGGVEQNGSHLPLGKHNTVLRYTSEQIAHQLGHTFINPIVPFVPEGRIHPPEGHMQWSGTISLSPSTFESLLLDIILSAQEHGFRYICILGEHGASQEIQLKVAQSLNDKGIAQPPLFRGRFVLQVDAYYSDEEQRTWLHTLGETDQNIGHHAGLMDTAEWMAINAQQPGRDGEMRLLNTQSLGSDGDPHHATTEMGQHLLRLKIQHAVNQIRDWKKAHA